MSVALVAAEPASVARATIAHHSKSFALASRLLGPRLRDQTAVIYTWCRRADDAIDEPGLQRRGSTAEGQCGVIDEPGSPRRGSTAEGQCGVIDEPGLPRRGSTAEGQCGVIDEPGLPRRGSTAEGQCGVIDEPGSPRRGSTAEGQCGVIDEPGLPRRGSTAEGQCGVIDEGHEDGAIARLDHELVAAYAGDASDPVLAAFGAVARERAIPIAYPRELLAGMAMDVHGTTYRSVEDVIEYAWRVAGVVGLMMTHVFGCAEEGALIHAAHLGIAMQLTNICRDVAEDWQRDRLYLPDELLASHGAANLAGDLTRPLPSSAHPAIAATTRDLLELAERYYRSGDRGISKLPMRAAIAVRAARMIYASIGDRIARADYAVTAGRAIVPTSHKLALAATALVRGAFHLPRRYHIPHVTLELANVPRC